MSDAYGAAGVSLEAADESVSRLKPLVQRTMRPEVLGGIGGFGGLFQLDLERFRQPVLVSGADGVGTKLKIAHELGQHDTIGIDLVAMCVNDILVQGAEPLFFLDYFACGKLSPAQLEAVVSGISTGCVQAGCALLGGETAEMPGMYAGDDYDLAGFAVGAVDRDRLIDGQAICPGDALIGIASSGVHSNGFSLVRKLLADHQLALDARLPGSETSLGPALLEPTRIYVQPILKLLESVKVRGMAHVTGGGLPGNVPRMLPDGAGAVLQRSAWPVPPVLAFLQNAGGFTPEDLDPVFNQGLGFVLCVEEADVKSTLETLGRCGEQAFRVGWIEASPQPFRFA